MGCAYCRNRVLYWKIGLASELKCNGSFQPHEILLNWMVNKKIFFHFLFVVAFLLTQIMSACRMVIQSAICCIVNETCVTLWRKRKKKQQIITNIVRYNYKLIGNKSQSWSFTIHVTIRPRNRIDFCWFLDLCLHFKQITCTHTHTHNLTCYP